MNEREKKKSKTRIERREEGVMEGKCWQNRWKEGWSSGTVAIATAACLVSKLCFSIIHACVMARMYSLDSFCC